MEDRNSALNSLLRRKKAVESLLSLQKRRTSDRSPSDQIVGVVESSSTKKTTPNKSRKRPKTPCTPPPFKKSLGSLEESEVSDAKTPLKRQSIRRISASSEDSIPFLNKTSSSSDVIGVIKTSNPNKPSSQSKKQQKIKTCTQTPDKTSVDVIENSDVEVETPVKKQWIQRTCASPEDNIISTSTICLSRSHNFFKTPETTPVKISSSLFSSISEMTSVSAFDYNTPSTSTAAEDFCHYLPSAGPKPNVNSAAHADHSAHTVVNDARHHVPSIGSETAEPADSLPVFAHTIVDDAHRHVPSNGSENAAPANATPASTHAPMEDAHCNIPSTGSETDELVDSVTTFQRVVVDNAHHQFPSTGSKSAAPVDHSPVSAHTVVDDANQHVPSTESECTAPAYTSPASAHALMENAYCHVPSTGSETDELVDSVTTFQRVVVDNAHRHFPSSGSDSAAPVDHSPVSAHTVVDDANHHVPSTESESTAPAYISPASAHALIEDSHSHVTSTGTETAEPVESLIEHVVMDDAQRHFPSTGTDPRSAAADHSPSSDTNKLTKSQQRQKRHKTTKSFKKSCMDFVSDEEQEDFSAGSSDVWTCSDSSMSSYDEQSKKKKKHRKIQVKKSKKNEEKSTEHIKDAEVTITKRKTKVNVRKINQNLKNEGKEYVTPKGKLIVARSMKENPCIPEKCKRGCYEISEDRRKNIFTFYWNLDVNRRRDWLVRCARVDGIRRKRVESNRRKLTVDYFINYNEDHKKVCQKFLLCTLDITQRHLNNIISNALEGMSRKDLRKRSAKGKYSESAKENVRKFIESLPACPSHYNRKKSQRMYLSQDLRNLTNLFRIYCVDCRNKNEESVSESMFREIFNKEYDLGFHSPKKDKCVLCTKAENTENEMTEEDKEILKKHKEEKEASYKRFKAHQTLKDAKTVCSSFDLQKVLNTPYGESMLLYYARKYAVFNFTVYESITQNVYCYTWGECDGKRGSNEIATCLYFYLKELDKHGIETALLYCDSCTGQNKNRVVLSVLNYFLLKSNNLQVIQINYLLPGHTYMPADSVHATIESEVKKIIVWSPTQWASYFETARKKPKPYKVDVIEHTDFINWNDLAAKTFTKETSKNIKFKSIRTATFKKKNLNKVEIKYSMKEDAVSEKVTLFETANNKAKGKGKGKGKGKRKKAEEPEMSQREDADYLQDLNNISLLQSYVEKLPISALKYKDLKKLCTDGTIPKRFHKDFLEMPYSGNKDETLIETDEEDDDFTE